MKKIDLTIVIPYYNNKDALYKTLHSLFFNNQYLFNCIVVDDGSIISLEEEEIACFDNTIHIARKSNGGVSSARNYGLNLALSEWIVFIDSGDIVTEDYLDKFLQIANANHDCKMLCFAFEYSNYSSLATLPQNNSPDFYSRLLDYNQYLDEVSDGKVLFVICSSFYKTTMAKKIGGFSTEFSHGEDHHFILRYLKEVEWMVFSYSVIFYYIQDDLNSATRRPGYVPVYGHTKLLQSYTLLKINEKKYFIYTAADNFIVNIRKGEVKNAFLNLLSLGGFAIFIHVTIAVLRRFYKYAFK